MVRFAICDDQKEDLQYLSGSIANIMGELAIPYSVMLFESGADLLEGVKDTNSAYRKGAYDIVILDIYMKDNGIDTAALIRETDEAVKIIFVTGSMDDAIKAYDVFAYNYILKPVNYERLKAVLCLAVKDSIQKKAGCLQFKADQSYYSINYQDIIYIESIARKTVIYTASGNKYAAGEPLNAMFKRLSDDRFLKPHNSVAVNMDHIVRVADGSFIMSNGCKADITKRFFALYKNKYFDYISNKSRSGNN